MRNTLLRLLAVLITLALLVWLIQNAHWDDVLMRLRRINPLVLLAAVALFALSYWLRAARVFDEFRHETGAAGNTSVSSFRSLHFLRFLRLTLIHNALVNVAPLRTGELAFPVLLRRWFGVPPERSVVALLWLRIQDALVVLGLAALVWPGLPWALHLLAVLAVVFIAWAIPGSMTAWMNRHKVSAPSAPVSGRIQKIRAALAQSTRSNRRSWLWTLANWSVKLSAEMALLASLLSVSVNVAALGALGAELAAILPIQGVAGFGTFEAGAAALMRPYNVVLADGLQAALALHLIMLACALLAGGLAAALLPGEMKQTIEASTQPKTVRPE